MKNRHITFGLIGAYIFNFGCSIALAQESNTFIPTPEKDSGLAESFKTGKFNLSQIPTYLTYIINLALYAAALIAVVFIIYGGFLYILSPLSENKEAGKNTIMHAILGLVLSILSWFIVNAAIYIATS